MSTSEQQAEEPQAEQPVIDDAGDMRPYYFREILGQRQPWIRTAVAAVVLGVIAYFIFDPITAVIIFLLSFGARAFYAFNVARSHAAADFFQVYASEHNLALNQWPYGTLPPATPLLRKGVERYSKRRLTGELAEGVDGVLATYTYVTETIKGAGNNDTHYHNFTLAMIEVPGTSDPRHEVFCQRKPGRPTVEGIEEAHHDDRQRVELESRAFDEKYNLLCAKDQDQNWLRRLFSPGFIVWLAESAPAHFAFEFADGVLVAYLPGYKEDAADLDRLRAAAVVVAKRLGEMSE